MRLALALVLLAAQAWAEASPETQLTLTSLRPGEKEQLAKAVGPAEEMPLYRAQLEVDPKARTVSGKLYVSYPARAKTLGALLLRVPPNAVTRHITLSNAVAGGAPTTMDQPEPTLYRVKLDPTVAPGALAEVEVRLDAKVPLASQDSDSLTSAGAGGAADFGAFSAAPEVLSLSGLLPGVPPTDDQGHAWPGPSGIGDLASFEPSNWLISVTVPNGWRVLAPGNQLGEVPRPGGKMEYAYGVAGARDFALFVTQGYQSATAKVGDVTVEAWYVEADAASGKRVLRYAADALAELQKHLTPYPWTTLRVVESRLVGGAGGMEFPGLISISTSLFRGATDPLAALGMPGLGAIPALAGLMGDLKPLLEHTLEFTIAHEVAHQWFAMVVGNDPVDEPVVDEPLTQHVALLYMEWKHGKKAADAMRDAQLRSAYQVMRMMGGNDGEADRPTREFGSSNEYAAIIYGKAPMLFDALRKQSGDAAYFKALKSYAEAYRWKNAHDTSFTAELTKASPASAKGVEKLRRHWWLEKHGDEDIGEAGAGGLLSGLTGASGGQAQPIDAETQKLIEEAIKALGGE